MFCRCHHAKLLVIHIFHTCVKTPRQCLRGGFFRRRALHASLARGPPFRWRACGWVSRGFPPHHPKTATAMLVGQAPATKPRTGSGDKKRRRCLSSACVNQSTQRDGLAFAGCGPPLRRSGGSRVGLDSAQGKAGVSWQALSTARPGLVAAPACSSAGMGDGGDAGCVDSQLLPDGVGDHCHTSAITDRLVQIHTCEGEITDNPTPIRLNKVTLKYCRQKGCVRACFIWLSRC